MILGLGRALGEAIAVAMVIGDFNGRIHANLFGRREHDRRLARGRVLERDLDARALVSLLSRPDPPRLLAPREHPRAGDRARVARTAGTGGLVSAADFSVLQRPNDRLRRRRVVNRGMELARLARGGDRGGAPRHRRLVGGQDEARASSTSTCSRSLRWRSRVPGGPQGGLVNAFVGTFVLVGLATLMALPVGILVALYVNEFAPGAIQEWRRTDPGRPQRHPRDRDRDLRLRPARRGSWLQRLSPARSRSRADAPARRPHLDRGSGARARFAP